MENHNFIERETKNNHTILYVCENCGVTKNHLTENYRCKQRDIKPLEKLLVPIPVVEISLTTHELFPLCK